jgi:hypothetical protein
MIAPFAARLLCGLAVLAPVVLALQPTQAAATVRLAAAADPLVVRLATTDRLYVRGADLAIVNSGACSLLAQAERLECLATLSRNPVRFELPARRQKRSTPPTD